MPPDHTMGFKVQFDNVFYKSHMGSIWRVK
jgi:hypothetical protein